MFKCGDFIVLRNRHGHRECYRISTINAVYFDTDVNCYTILFSDGQEVLLEVSIEDGVMLIDVLI